MPVDFSNAQSIMFWGAVALDESTATHTEQPPAKTPGQIAEEQHQNTVGAGIAGMIIVLFVAFIILGERKK